ncbi:hypothetical protein J4430_00585 [Candidatus Woesearchaeota archaeon]|nr:hypothetical protein [Candidatus Woesearchaeota archaeon]
MNNFIREYNTAVESEYFSVPQYAMGAPTSINTANQIAEATKRLNSGVFGVDLAPIRPDIFEQIPKQHFEEINRLMKLTGAKASIHGPIMDLVGFQQNRWDESERKNAENQLGYFLDMAHKLDPKGNTPINFHANTQTPGETWRKMSLQEKEYVQQLYKTASQEEKKYLQEFIDKGAIKERAAFINQETGEIGMNKFEVKRYIGRDKIWTPDEYLENQNHTMWDKEKLDVLDLQKTKSEIADNFQRIVSNNVGLEYAHSQGVVSPEELREYEENKNKMKLLERHMHEIDVHIRSRMEDIHHKFQKYTPAEEKKEILKEFENFEKTAQTYGKQQEIQREAMKDLMIKYRKHPELLESEHEIQKKLQAEVEKKLGQKPVSQDEMLHQLNQLPAPKVFIPTTKFAQEKTVETVSNTAWEAYQKYGKNSPLITIENYQPELTIGSSKELRDTIERAQEKFAEKLQKEKRMGEKEAMQEAQKLIGVTWDVGHINFMRKLGYTEKDILKETEIIAPHVKQLHITDNFGFSDAHMPPGMGNAPIKEQIERLKKHGFEAKKGNVIVEAGAFVAQFKENPHLYALEYFNSPLYSMKVAPYWPQMIETQGSYGLGMGPTLPETHFRDLYGGGFSNLPPELGGQRGGDRGRFAQGGNQ